MWQSYHNSVEFDSDLQWKELVICPKAWAVGPPRHKNVWHSEKSCSHIVSRAFEPFRCVNDTTDCAARYPQKHRLGCWTSRIARHLCELACSKVDSQPAFTPFTHLNKARILHHSDCTIAVHCFAYFHNDLQHTSRGMACNTRRA